MAKAITALTELAVGDIDDADKLVIVDVTAGTTHWCTRASLRGGSLGISDIGGYVQRPVFAYVDADTITVGPFRAEHNGTTQQMIGCTAPLTYVFGSGGSNADSSDLGASTWQYLYADDSAIVSAATDVISETELVNSTTEPTWSATKQGWYNGSDRCFGAFLTDGDGDLLSFVHDGGDYLEFIDPIISRALSALTTSWADVTLNAPVFGEGSAAHVTFYHQRDGGGATLYYRHGTAASNGHLISQISSEDVRAVVPRKVFISATQKLQVTGSATGTKLVVYTNGYFFPRGM